MSTSGSAQPWARDGASPGGAPGASGRVLRFVDLVFGSNAIVIGTVASVGPPGRTGAPEFQFIRVARALRGSPPEMVQVATPLGVQDGQAVFSKGDSCMVFLVLGAGQGAELLGTGDMGKWPRTKADWAFTAGHVQPLPQVVRVVAALLEIDGMNSYEDRAVALVRDPLEANSLGQIAALQYAAEPKFWPQDRLRGQIDLRTTRRLLGGKVLLEKEPLDMAAEVELTRILQDLPRSVAFPKWVDGLEHSDVALRDTAFTAVKPAAGEDFGYDARAGDGERATAVARWRGWLEQRRPWIWREEVPQLLEDLRSSAPLRRRAADLLLRVVSGQDVGFDADDKPAEQDAAAKRWDDWWAKTKESLPQ